jgi:hypothetical protein
MRPMFVVSAGVTLLLIASGPGSAVAGNRGRTRGTQSAADSSKDKETSASFNRQFQWEEKVVGPKDKGVDHEKIAALQEQGRREDEARRREGQPKKTPRADGIGGPASATLPTMDIEKPAPAGSIRSPMRKASYTPPPPRRRDDIDNALADNSGGPEPGTSGQDGLGKLLAGPSRPAARPTARHATRAKHARAHARRRR